MNSKKVKSVLEEIKKLDGADHRYWILHEESAQLLKILIKVFRPRRILEIGTGIGYSVLIMGKEAALYGGKIVTVESNQERFSMASEHIKKAGLFETISIIHGHAPKIFEQISGSFDLIFLDATKEEHQKYFNVCWPILNSGGLLIIDNVISHAAELEAFLKFLEGFSGLSGGGVLNIGMGLGVYRKRELIARIRF